MPILEVKLGDVIVLIFLQFNKKTRELLLLQLNLKKQKTLDYVISTYQLQRLLAQKDGISWLKIFDLIWVGGASISEKLQNNV